MDIQKKNASVKFEVKHYRMDFDRDNPPKGNFNYRYTMESQRRVFDMYVRRKFLFANIYSGRERVLCINAYNRKIDRLIDRLSALESTGSESTSAALLSSTPFPQPKVPNVPVYPSSWDQQIQEYVSPRSFDNPREFLLVTAVDMISAADGSFSLLESPAHIACSSSVSEDDFENFEPGFSVSEDDFLSATQLDRPSVSVDDVATSSAIVQQPESDESISSESISSESISSGSTLSESIPSESATKITTETFDGKAQAIKRYESLKDCFDDANAYMLEPDSLRKRVSALLLLTPCVVQVREHDQEPDLSAVMIDDETVPVKDQMPGWIDHSYVYRGDDEDDDEE